MAFSKNDIHIDPGTNGGDANMYFNFSFEADPEIKKWILNKDFRRALSMATDRDQINEAFFLGLGTSGSAVPAPNMPEYPGDEWRTKWHTLDVDQANALLDKIGLDKKDSSGMRLRTDGKGVLRIEINTTNSFVNYSKVSEMIVPMWKKIGIQLDIKDMERATWEQNRNANLQQIAMWSNGGTELLYLYPIHALPVQENSQVGPLIAQWYGTAGAKGIAPTDPDLKKCMELYAEAQTKKLEERNKIAQELKLEEAKVRQVEKEQAIKVEELEIKRREKELDANVLKPSDARKYQIKSEAEAEEYRIQAEARGKAEAVRLEGQAAADSIKQRGAAEAEAMTKKAPA